MDFDYGIIGGGPAGYTVAMNLASQGHKVVLFEKDKLGGTCLNRGCIPTKSLLHSSEIYRQILKSSDLGLDIEVKNFDFSKIAQKRDDAVEKIRKGLELAVKNSGVTVVYSEAKALNQNTILADSKEYNINKVIFATGSKPREVKGLEFDNNFILSSDDVLKLNSLPNSVLIIGSGAIGIEWARIFSNFGVEVSIVEMAEHLIPLADTEVSKRVERIFKQRKIKFFTNDSIDKIENKIVTLKSGNIIQPDFILSAIGRVPIDETTTGIEALGDIRGEILLAHYAIQQGLNYANGENLSPDKNLIPSVIYGEPEIAWVGLREQDCPEECKKISLPITALGKSWCDDATEGFIKILTKEGYIIGAHIVSKEASALIQQLLIVMQNNIKIDDLKKVCFAHPTYSEGIFEAICRL
ncbi:MAG: NAD(P)/FAD-dependent oxidoreductase [Cyanobacteria bacterium SIG31]|nr:NAD(P)/FAD-dependent oxidoreductase [Cyanobacteria bacterium SIG31]